MSFDDILRKIFSAHPKVKAAAIVSPEGLPIASWLPPDRDETRITAMTATLLSLSERVVIDMEMGEFKELCVKGDEGYLLITQAGPYAVLTVSGDFDDSDNDEGDFPFPYIFKPPSPPGDLARAGQLQVQESITMQVHRYETYCKHCGVKLPKGQAICHNCGKKVI